jgi:hypothetical protein
MPEICKTSWLVTSGGKQKVAQYGLADDELVASQESIRKWRSSQADDFQYRNISTRCQSSPGLTKSADGQ